MGQRTKMHNPKDLMALAEFVEQGDSHTKGTVWPSVVLAAARRVMQRAAGTVAVVLHSAW